MAFGVGTNELGEAKVNNYHVATLYWIRGAATLVKNRRVLLG